MSNINLDRFPTSTTAQRMLHRVSPIYSEAYTMKWLYEVMGRELDDVWDIVREMPEQAFTQTVTWGIEAQEYKYNITPDDSLSLDERRARLYRKKTSKFPISPGRIEKYIRDAWDMSVDIDEARAAGTFFLRILSDKNHHLRRMLDDLYGIKPSHLAMLAVWAVGPHFFLNRAGAIQLRTTPGQTWTTQEPYIVFDTGLNAAGSTETVKHTDTATQQHSAYIFSGSTLNGRIHINGGGKYSLGEYDAGQDITESWKVFRIEKPPTLNGVAKLNATPTETRSRSYHVTEWRTMITKRADVISASDIVSIYPVASAYEQDSDQQSDKAALKELFAAVHQQAAELEAWKNQRVQQGTATIYNKFVVFGGIVNAISGTRNVKVTRTGTYDAKNYSLLYVDGHFASIYDTQDSVAAVPANSSSAPIDYYAYVDGTGDNYTVKVADRVPDGKLGLYRITVPAGDTAANLNAVKFTDIRRVESRYRNLYGTIPSTTVRLPYAAIGSAYDVNVSIESTAYNRDTVLEVVNKGPAGFTIRSHGEADNIVVRWTMTQPNA